MDLVHWHLNTMKDFRTSESLAPFELGIADQVWRYHRSWAQYHATPLRPLPALAARWGLREVLIKDESCRWGLKAFKGLGGTHVVGRYLTRYYGLGDGCADFPTLRAHRDARPQVVFTTATDGNHGVGIAWAARQLGHSAKIFMPRGSARARVEAIRAVGGDVEVTDRHYDATVKWVAEESRRQGWVLVQDTAWDGYQDIPQWIMQGYLTLMAEEFLCRDRPSLDKPTHVFVQAGVGSFAAATVAFLAHFYGDALPLVVVVEPTEAACFLRSASVGNGTLFSVDGSLSTVMAGLACGVANPVAWDILKHWTTAFVACQDAVTARGMRILGNPINGDERIVAGESGAVGLGLLSLIMENPAYQDLRRRLELSAESRVLLVNTEGATDPVMYHRIVWDGFLGTE